MTVNFSHKKSKIILSLYLSTLILLPFSRLAELPILILAIIGVQGLFIHKLTLKNNQQFTTLSLIFACYFFAVFISSFDSYWQQKTLIVALSSFRFYFASIALILYVNSVHFKSLLKIIAIITVFWACDAMLQYLIGFDIIGRTSYAGRLTGIFGEHHVKLGPVLAFLLPIVMIGLINQKSGIRWASIFVIVLVIILSGTRSAWIMAFVTLLAYWFHHVKQRRFQLLLKSAVVSLIMIMSLWFISPEFKQRIDRSLTALDGTHSGLDFALANRLPIWSTAWHMIEKHPINGIGAHAFREAYPEFASENDVWQQQGGVGMHAHHWLLEILADTGLIGLLLISFAIFKLATYIRRNTNENYTWAYMVALITMFLPITSTYSIFASFWSICIWFVGAGLILVSNKESYSHE